MDLDLKKNEEKKLFEATVDGFTSLIEFIWTREVVYLTHTEVPAELGGRGIGKALVLSVLTELKAEGMKVAPLCPFVAAYIKKNPEWIPLVAKGYNVG